MLTNQTECLVISVSMHTSIIIVNVIVYDLAVDSAPHKNLHSIHHVPQNRGFQTLASADEFQSSLTCTT